MPAFSYRIPPCPYWDTATMEHWLEEMAEKGLILGNEGIFPGIVAFEKAAPQKIRYRMIVSEHPYRKARAYRYAPIPDGKTQAFHEEFGWKYIATRRDFHIYACTDPNAPEMDTDPQIQAIGYAQAAKRQKTDVVCYSLIFAIHLLMLLWKCWEFLLGTSHRLSLYHIWMIPMWLFYLIPALWGYRQLRRRQKLLQTGAPLPHRPGYQKTAAVYWFTLAGKALVLVSLFLAVFASPPSVYRENDWTALSEYTGEIPFATMQELLPDARFREDAHWTNAIARASNSLSDTCQLTQQLHITLPDGTETSGRLDVVRRKTRLPAAAHAQAVAKYKRGTRTDRDPTMLDIQGIDYAFYFKDSAFDYIVMQKDDLFLQVSFHIYSGDPITPEEIARTMAPYLTQQQ